MSEYLFKTDKEIKTCQECPIVKRYGLSTTCPLREGAERKYDTCPLEEVQTHGDLVDRQKLIKALSKAWDVDDDQDFANKSVWRIVEKEAPTVIEASTK